MNTNQQKIAQPVAQGYQPPNPPNSQHVVHVQQPAVSIFIFGRKDLINYTLIHFMFLYNSLL